MENSNIIREIISVFEYFQYFNYLPTFDEIYCFLKTKTSRGKLEAVLGEMEKKKVVTSYVIGVKGYVEEKRYTLGEYGINIKNQSSKIKVSHKKLSNIRFRLYIKLLSLFPQIQLIGLSGTLAMNNAEDKDDIDLFIITAKNRLFTGRFIAIVMSYVLGVRRGREQINQQKSEEIRKDQEPENPDRSDLFGLSDLSDVRFHLTSPISADLSGKFKDKICLNLFFDESNLIVPKHKQTEYVAHEVLQMKPIVNKNSMYERFLEANKWVDKIFPNAIIDSHGFLADSHRYSRKSVSNLWKSFFNIIDLFLKNLQLYLIKQHRTTEIITNNQLWFHPKDFGKKIQF